MKRLTVLFLFLSVHAYASDALVIMDAWKNSNAMQRKIITEKINPLVRAFLDRGYPVINAANNADDYGGVSPLLALQERMIRLPKDGLLIPSTRQHGGMYIEQSALAFFNLIRKHKLNTFYYCGFSSSMCLMTRPSGILRLEQMWHHTDLPYNDLKIYLVGDASAAETPQMHEAMCRFFSLTYGKVIKTADVLKRMEGK